jgi:predicted phosphodiesterase
MIIAIFSDVHANLPALEKFIQETRRVADAYLCIGDVVDYGPWNDECLEMVLSLPGIVFLEGNHERLFLGTDPVEDELPLVQDFIAHSKSFFTRVDLIEKLPATFNLGQFCCVHTINNAKIYPDTEITLTRDYIIGHTHHQFEIEQNGKRLINCGSVGQNRGSVEILNYALYDVETKAITLCESPFKINLFIQEMKARSYPPQCVEYYTKKLHNM